MGLKALALSESGDKEQALSLANDALALDAGNAPAVAVVVQEAFRAGDQDRAMAVVTAAQETNPTESKIAKMKISLLQSMGRTDQVEAELKSLVKENPEDVSYMRALVSFYVRESKVDEAEAALREYAERSDEDTEGRMAVVAFLLKHKTKQAAIDEVNTYIEQYPDQEKYRLGLAQLYLFTGENEQATRVLKETIERSPRSVASLEARNTLAGMALQADDFVGGKALLEEVLAIEPENEPALLARAKLYVRDKDYKSGISDLRAILKNSPEAVDAIKLLAHAQTLEGNEDLALDNYKKLMSLQQPDMAVLASAARLAIRNQAYDEAEGYIRQALELDADNTTLVTNLIQLLALKEDWKSAEGFVDQLIANKDSAALGYFLQGGINAKFEEHDAAIASYKKSLDIEPKAARTLTAITQLLVDKKGLDAGIQYVDDHCKKYPAQAQCFFTRGSLYAQQGNMGAAMTDLRKSVELEPKLVAAYRQIAKVNLAQKDIAAAEAVLREGVEKSDNQALRFELAGFLIETEKFNDARAIYVSMLEKNEKNLAVKNNLAMLYAEYIRSPENLKEARALIADLQDSENPAYLDTVGWVFYLTGDYTQAVTYLQAAVNKVESSGLLQYHLGMAHYKAGNLDSAREHLTLAVADQAGKYRGIDEAQATLAELSQ